MEINPTAQTNNTQTPKKPQIYQTGIKGENVEIKADNVYIINNNYNQPVYNKYYNPYYYNDYSYPFTPGFGCIQFYFPYFWPYTLPFVPWNIFILPCLWGW
ncbi:MAG: hypothetical protein ACK4GJ_05640 [bacterium]